MLLVLPRRHERALEAEHLAVGARAVLEQLLDCGEVEAVRLHLGDQFDPRDVLGPVIARATLDLGRLQQAARLVRTDVAHGHPGQSSESIDRQLFGNTLRDHPHILRRFM